MTYFHCSFIVFNATGQELRLLFLPDTGGPDDTGGFFHARAMLFKKKEHIKLNLMQPAAPSDLTERTNTSVEGERFLRKQLVSDLGD